MKHFASTIVVLALAAFAGPSAAEAPPGAGQAQIHRILADISPRRIESRIRKLAGFGTRHTMSDTASEVRGIGAARRWIMGELERCNAESGDRLKLAYDSYMQIPTASLPKGTEIVNVVATLEGEQPEAHDRIYLVSGHYDSRATNNADSTSDAPGANDDASGTAAVMELACVMAHYRFDATLVFIAVAGEEQGLFGSAHWARQAREKHLNIAGMFTNDIIGSSRAEDGHVDSRQVRLFAEGITAQKELSDFQLALIRTGGENDTPARQLARHVKEMGERHVAGFKVSVVQRRDRYLRGGDHLPFLEQGYAALRFTEPNEDYRHQHQDVRAEGGVAFGDLPEFVDFDYTAQVTRVNAAALASLALAPASPAQVKMQTVQLENDTTLSWAPNREPDLKGYRIVWRDTTAPDWQQGIEVGNVTRHTVKGLSKDNYFFGVQAVDRDGNVSPASYPLPQKP